MINKIKTIIKHPYFQQFRDVRAVGLLAFGVIVILVSWSGVKAIQTNYELQKQISALEQKSEVQKLENSNLALKNEYLKTDQYLELSARRQFGKAAPGETVVLVPKSVALAHTVDIDTKNGKKEAATHKPAYQKNFEAWVSFFLNRQSRL